MLGVSNPQPSGERKHRAGEGKDKTEALHPAWAERSELHAHMGLQTGHQGHNSWEAPPFCSHPAQGESTHSLWGILVSSTQPDV